MKSIVRLIALVFSFIFCCIIVFSPVDAFATVFTEDGTQGSSSNSYFEEMSREAYIEEYALSNGISYAEAEKEIDQEIEAALSAIPAPASWKGDTSEYNGDTTYTVYGRVICDYEHESGATLCYRVQAVMLFSHYGSTWISCNPTGTVTCGSGYYTFEGDCTASLMNNRQLRMVMDGVIEVEVQKDTSIGINLAFLSFDRSVGSTYYYRADIYDVHVETTSVQGG